MNDALREGEADTDEVLVYARRVAIWQIENIMTLKETAPGKRPTAEEARARARDARTLNELVRTLERLDALEKNRKSGGRKTKVKDDAELKEALVRRLDQLVAGARARETAGKPDAG
jgi:hypothetical protein